MSIYAGPETIKAVVDISNVQWTVDLVRVAADGDAARPWRIDMPGERFDGWLMANSDLLARVS